jgi:hypothetical protein
MRKAATPRTAFVGIAALRRGGLGAVITEISRNSHWLIKTERRPASDPSATHRQAPVVPAEGSARIRAE